MKKLHPTVLVLCCAAVLAVCLALDPWSPAQAAVILGIVLAWLALSRVPARRVGKLVLFGLTLFLPVFLFAPWIEGGDVILEVSGLLSITTQGLLVPVRIAARGMVCVLVGAGLVRSADLTTLAVGLGRIPLVPRTLVVMTVQTLRWSAVLVEESRGISRAIALRHGGGLRGGLGLVRSLPLVWLPRVIARAERVTAAMEVRGYGGELPEGGARTLGGADLVGVGSVAVVILAAALVR